MSYKTLVTVFRNPKSDAAHLTAAVDLADRWGAHLDVLAIGIERLPPGANYSVSTSALVESALSEAIEDAKAAKSAAEAILSRSHVAWSVQRMVGPVGVIAQDLGRSASLSDMVVLPKPYGPGRNAEDVCIVEAALFSTRTAVLVLPSSLEALPPPKRIVIAWNQTAEALSAIRAALPYLQGADLVSVAVVDPQTTSHSADPGTQLAGYLDRQGVNVEVSILARSLPRTSDVLARHMADVDADLMVMGAYGHSRFRESILGGTTRNLLEETEVPLLMSH